MQKARLSAAPRGSVGGRCLGRCGRDSQASRRVDLGQAPVRIPARGCRSEDLTAVLDGLERLVEGGHLAPHQLCDRGIA